VLCVAPVFPIVVARIAHLGRRTAIGIVKLGAHARPSRTRHRDHRVACLRLDLYVVLALIGLACLPLARRGPAIAGGAR